MDPVTVSTGGALHPSLYLDPELEERDHIERIVLHGGQRDWLGHLSEAVRLIDATEHDMDPAVTHARELAIEVIANHHNLLLGLPGRAAERTAEERKRLGGSA